MKRHHLYCLDDMEVEINNENKAKFFAQYWNQEVIDHEDYNREGCLKVSGEMIRICYDDYYLLLKPLSSISDEDAEIIDLESEDYNENGWWDKHGNFYWWSYADVDYLRSKGYALPWMGLSVEEMVEAGWIKLTES